MLLMRLAALQMPVVVSPHAGRMSHTTLGILLAVGAAICFAVFVLYGAKIDGDRQRIREHGQHPVTDSDGEVHAREEERP